MGSMSASTSGSFWSITDWMSQHLRQKGSVRGKCALRVAGQDSPSASAPSPSELQVAEDVWTTGPILEAVNQASLNADSKTFVDQPLLTSAAEAMAAFEQLPKLENGSVARNDLQSFVDKYFGSAGSDLANHTATDYLESPPDFLPKVTNETIRQWGYTVNGLWNYLSRMENESVSEEPEKHSLLILPNPAVVAGDRFREIYYWDSYFIVEGLIVSGMLQTAKNVVENLVFLLEQHGLVPNGARTYYLNRSQPPLLSEMVRAVYQATNDTDFLEDVFDALVKEHQYWTSSPVQVTVQSDDGTSHKLSRYWSDLYAPRPESYREDVETAEEVAEDEREELWHNLAAGAASGWDFSSRWFADGQNLSTCRASMIIPADLNAFLYQMETNLAMFAEILGRDESEFVEAAMERKEAMNTLLWNATAGYWQDLWFEDVSDNGIVTNTTSQTGIYASNWVPLWAGLVEPQSSEAVAASQSLAASGLIRAGGVLTSLYNTSQQWDLPNAWPCLQFFAVEGLNTYGDASAQQLAGQVAQAWLESNYVGFLQNGGKMVEKYDAITPGVSGGGGEYNVQTGFGWTNGVMLYFLQHYGWNPDNTLPQSVISTNSA